MSDVLNVLTAIENYLIDLPMKIILKADQIFIVNGLSDVSENLGIITAGEYRSGNRLEPGKLFSGMRMAYPPMTYSASEWNLVGVNADVLQFGVRASDGKLLAGGGAVILDASGITATAGLIAGWTINTDHLLSDGTPGIKILSTGTIETSDFVSGILGKGWRISEAGDAEFNNAVVRGELRTTVLSYQEVQAVSGTMGVFQSAGVLRATYEIPAAGDATITVKDPEYGHAALFAVDDILWIKDGTNSTWLKVKVVLDNTTYYTYGCSIESGDREIEYTAGQAIVNFGVGGEGFLLMEAIGTGAPYFSVRTHAGAPYTATTEHVRMGNLNGNWGYSSDIYGAAIGQYASGKGNITIDPTDGIKINVYNTNVMQFTSTGSYITNVLNMSGASAAIAIGTTPPTSATVGYGIWLDRTGMHVRESTSGQLLMKVDIDNFYVGFADDTIKIDTLGLVLIGDPASKSYAVALSWRVTSTSGRYGTIGGLMQWGGVPAKTQYGLDISSYGTENGSGGWYPPFVNIYAANQGSSKTFQLEVSEYGYGGVLDGWMIPSNRIPAGGHTFTYVSATSFTVTDYLATQINAWVNILTRGTKIRFTQNSVIKYCYVVSASAASNILTVNVIGDTVLDTATYPVDMVTFYYSHAAEANGMVYGSSTFIPLTTPLTSTSYDGGDTVGVGTVTIDTSSVFSAPVGIKAVSIFARAKWASATMSSYLLVRPVGASRYCDIIYARDTNHQTISTIIPCDSNGDFNVVVANANALEVVLEIHGYWI